MSRTLSIEREGPRAVQSRPWPYLSWPEFPLTARVGSTPVWQFNIRPSRRMRQVHRCAAGGHSPVCLSCDTRAWRLRRRTKKSRMGPTPVEQGFRGKDPDMFCGARRQAPSAIRPTAQHQQASSRATATLATLLCLPASSMARRRSTSLLTPALAVPARRLVDYLLPLPGLSATSTLPL